MCHEGEQHSADDFFDLSQCLRRHEVSRTRDNNNEDSHKAERERKQHNRRLSAHQSATSATQDLNRFSILCDPQKCTTCLDVHHSACLKHSNFFNRSKPTKGQGFKQFRFQHGPFTKHFGSAITGIVLSISTYPPSPNRVLENR